VLDMLEYVGIHLCKLKAEFDLNMFMTKNWSTSEVCQSGSAFDWNMIHDTNTKSDK
jgi:hypothetical protein